MKKLFLSVMALSLLFNACDSDDEKIYSEEERIENDVNGEYLLSKAFVGDLPVVDISYNDQNQITVVSTYSANNYQQELKSRVEKEYANGKVSKITSTFSKENYEGEKYNKVGGAFLEYDSKGNLVKIKEWENSETNVWEYIQNTYDSENRLAESRDFYFETDEVYDEETGEYVETDGEWFQEDGYLKYEYNSDNLLTKTIAVNKEGEEVVLSEIKYDDRKNPIEVYKYNFPKFDYNYDPINGDEQKILVEEGALVSIVQIEYDYQMKNFLGHTMGEIFPELVNLNMNNAPKRITRTGTVVAGSITYGDFNEGGYPQVIEYLGNNDEGTAYKGELKLEFVKKK